MSRAGKGWLSNIRQFYFFVRWFWMKFYNLYKNVKNFRKNRRLSPQFLDFETLLLCVSTDDTNVKEMWNCANYPIKFCFFFSEMTRFIAIPKFWKLARHCLPHEIGIYQGKQYFCLSSKSREDQFMWKQINFILEIFSGIRSTLEKMLKICKYECNSSLCKDRSRPQMSVYTNHLW